MNTPSLMADTSADWHTSPCLCTLPMVKDWNFVNAVYCICLRERPDRLVESAEQFHRVGLCPYVRYYRPRLDRSTHVKRPAARGGWESHRRVIRRARKNRERYILIFEDDVYWNQWMTPERLSSFASHMKGLPRGWDIYFLGHFPFWGVPVSWDLRVWRVWSAMCHAYIIDTRGNMAQYIARTPYDSLPQGKYGHPCIDMTFAKSAKAYAYYPMLALQSESKSSNPKKYPLSFVTDFILRHSRKTAVLMEWTTYFAPLILGILGLLLFIRIRIQMRRR